MAASVEEKTAELDPRQSILVLLYAPDGKKDENTWNWAAPVEGKTRLIKELFLLDKETPTGRRNLLGFRFTPGPYGPSSMAVTSTLDSMIRSGEVAVSKSPDPRARATVLRVVGKAGSEASQIWRTLPPDARRDIYDVKSRFHSTPYRTLLSYVYGRYPDFATNSLIRDEILDE